MPSFRTIFVLVASAVTLSFAAPSLPVPSVAPAVPSIAPAVPDPSVASAAPKPSVTPAAPTPSNVDDASDDEPYFPPGDPYYLCQVGFIGDRPKLYCEEVPVSEHNQDKAPAKEDPSLLKVGLNL